MPSCPRLAVRPGGVVGDDHQVRLLGRDRLDVRLQRREVRDRRVGRVVRVAVDRGHLRAGADGVEHLGRRRRERDDRPGLLVQRDAAVGRGDGDREGAGGGRSVDVTPRRRAPWSRRPRRAPVAAGSLPAASCCQPSRCRSCRRQPGRQPSCRPARGEDEAGGLRSHGSSSIDERRTKRARSAPGRRRTNHPSSEGSVRRCREGDRTRPPGGASPLRDSAGITPDFATVAPLGRVRARDDRSGWDHPPPPPSTTTAAIIGRHRRRVAAVAARRSAGGPVAARYGDRPCPGSS